MQYVSASTIFPVPNWDNDIEPEDFRSGLHRRALTLKHNLHLNPLFTLPAIQEAAEEASRRKDDFYYDLGANKVTDKWSSAERNVPVKIVFENIENNNAWIILRHVEKTSGYDGVLNEWASYMRSLAGDEAAKLLINPEMLIIISSPNKITPYHFDAEIGFLTQISGSKDVWVCDPMDRTITTEQEIEKYYGGNLVAGMYKAHAAERATHVFLEPGNAVHLPTHGAHWVKNHDNISISLNLNFEFPSGYQKDIYRMNNLLRKIGLSPRPPGSSPGLDRGKAAATQMIRMFKNLRH